ncbi:MAG TPA: hypothetical protein VFQ66_06525 [Candidatus Limnocylindria bacterium]|nr:hypothetical protein [Candidatus Limnocylindria bacterium]
MRTAARLRDVDATPSDHRGTGEPEHHADAHSELIAAQHCVAVAHRDRHTDDRPCERDTNTA